MREIKLIVLAFIFSTAAFSQEEVQLKGKIFADSLMESSIHILNITQKTGTVNLSSGAFEIRVRENDTLLFSSVQFKKITVPITAEIMDEGFLRVTLAEDINELTEVNISNISLTGNLEKDLANIEVVPGLGQALNINFENVQYSHFEADINDPQAAPNNLAFKENLINKGAGGVNLLGGLAILSNLVGIKESKTSYLPPPKPASTQIRDLFEDDFFVYSLEIEKDKIKDFLFYLDDVSLDSQLFREENKLALIEFLIDQSNQYKSFKTGE